MEENTVADVGVNRTAGISCRKPLIVPFNSSLKIAVGGILSACNIAIYWCNKACAGVADVRNFVKISVGDVVKNLR